MSVEITGPQGYEWQYRATCLIAVQNLDCESLVIEGIGGEDAQLQYHNGSEIHDIEIQAKSSEADLDLAILCQWLSHFPSREATNSLFSKLVSGSVRILFVAGGRCSDSTRPFIRELGSLAPHDSISTETCELVLKALTQYAETASTNTQLQTDRKSSLLSLAKELKNDRTSLKQALRRILVWESATLSSMERELVERLTKYHRIPQSDCMPVILLLEDAIRTARDQRADVSNEISEILRRKSSLAILGDEPHFPLGTEDGLLCQLKAKNTLLLKGRSQSGKTNMAKFLAQLMQEDGVNCAIGSEIAEATRFLTTLNEERRFFLLEDPFNNKNIESVLEAAESLLRLLSELRNHRFLIVTSTSKMASPIFHLLPAEGWIETTVSDSEILMSFWETRFGNDSRLIDLAASLRSGFAEMEPEQLPQIGHLVYLSRAPSVENKSFDEMMMIARFDIGSLAKAQVARGAVSRRTHIGLRIGASTVQRISMNDLAFLLSDTAERPGYDDFLGLSIGNDLTDSSFPDSPPPMKLGREYLDELEHLEALGHIRASTGSVEFAHPDYYEVSTTILVTGSAITLPNCLEILDRGLSSLNESVARSCASALPLFYRSFGSSDYTQHLVFEAGERAMHSIFPGVRDIALDAILEWLPFLNHRDRSVGISLIGNESSYSYGEIKWKNHTPWTSSSRSWADLFSTSPESQSTELQSLLDAMISGKAKRGANPLEAWDLVHFIESNSTVPGASIALNELMKQSHAFIRVKAIALLVKMEINNPQMYLTSLVDERNPNVLRSAISQSLLNWQNASDEVRVILRQWLLKAITKTPTAIVCSRILLNFGDPHSSGTPNYEKLVAKDRSELWSLWTDLLQVYLKTIANQPFDHNGAHMYTSLSVAPNEVDRAVFAGIVESWSGWIFGQLEMRMLDDYELAAAELLLKQVESGAKRERLITEMLNHRDTGFAITTLHFMVRYWEDLSSYEKSLLLEALASDRVDARWLRAAALTRDEVPPKIQELLLDQDDLLSKDVESILKDCPSELFSDALHLFCGKPQPLWWYGLAHSANERWQPILEAVLREPTHPKLDLALHEMLSSVLCSSGHRWSDPLGTWRNLCQACDETFRRRLFDHLLLASVRINNPQLYGFWKILFESVAEDAERKFFVDGIISNLSAISNNIDTPREFFSESVFDTLLAPKLVEEVRFLKACKKLHERTTQQEKRKGLDELKAVLLEAPPRLFYLYESLEIILQKSEIISENDARALAVDARSAFLEVARKQADALETKEEIWDWVYAFEK